MRELKGRKVLSLDIETSGLVAFKDEIEVITIRESGKTEVEFYHINKLRKDGKDKEFFKNLKNRLQGKAVLGHNLAFDFGFLYYKGINAIEDNIYLMDTMIASIIDRGDLNIIQELKKTTLTENDYYRTESGKFRKKHNLKVVTKYYLNKDISKEMQKSDWTLENLTQEQITYAKNDVVDLESIYVKAFKSIKAKGMLKILQLEENFIPAIIELNNNTLSVNKDKANNLMDELENDIQNLVTKYNTIVNEKITKHWGNLDNFIHQYSYEKWENYQANSKAKVLQKEEQYIKKARKDMIKGNALYSKDFGIFIPKTKAIFKYFFNRAYDSDITSTAKEVIQELINKGNELAVLIAPITAMIKEYNDIKKALNNLTPDGKIVTSYKQLGAITGRLTSSGIGSGKEKIGLNIQQINRDPRFREIFEAEKGKKLVLADYSGMELRIIAGVTKEKNMLDAFKQNISLHSVAGANINMIPFKEFQKVIDDKNHHLHDEYYKMRSIAKTMNFAIAYGAGAKTISERAGITIDEAYTNKNGYLENNPSVKSYLDIQKVKKVVESKLGRKMNTQSVITSREYHNITDWRRDTYKKVGNYWIAKGYADNFNYPIQSTGAEIVKLAIVNIIQNDQYLLDKVKLSLQVHDEIALQVFDNLTEKWKVLLQREMENAGKEVMGNIVKMVADANIGKNWNEAK